MASSYALPASTLTSHSHHGHGHLHSHSHSHSHSQSSSANRSYPSNSPNNPKTQRSNGSLHSHMHSSSESSANHNHEHELTKSNNSAHNHNHNYDRIPSLPTPPNSSGLASQSGPLEKRKLEYSPPAQANTYEPPSNNVNMMPHSHDHHHHHDSHIHTHGTAKAIDPRSRFTSLVLPYIHRWPLLHTIMAEKDSRRIFYFMSLNFAFMMVQACYGYITDSLGLLSDSIHMFFDCLALGVGLFAAVASKWPPSERFPYGFGKIESLSGFGNGVFLLLISVEIMIEATERLAEGRETKRLVELFVVSAMGLAVNLVGMACFGHHHHGHDHGDHSHGHSHSHSHEEEKAHSHDHAHDHHEHGHEHEDCHDHHTPLMSELKPAHSHDHSSHNHSHEHSHGHSHGHSHDNENMHGIFLHVLADTMGSAAVMVSTALIYFHGWSGWDPIASCIIAILIFLSSIPLIKSTAKKLLLTVPDGVEYNLRATISGVSDLRGVASYSVPRFWLGDNNGDSEGILGVMHITATRGSDLEDVRERTRAFLMSKGVDVVVQVEKDGDMSCWCSGSGSLRSPTASRFSQNS
ncbi:hypothetical protein HYFRA_00002312 [Hymenoscyphus fraxineus]|uniref:Zinc transporter n=1 Tax=Hymenoscyphus fraxineus TaxID=746836 RepID=A0A9N9L5L4_9HELO|nr:hypothetical protein HYFRA_00002312 [Hymenoscyphus fraxineus]